MDFNNSRIQQSLTCPASFKHRYLVNVVHKKKPIFFVSGSAIHKFIEFLYRTRDEKLALRQVEQTFADVNTELFTREEMHDLSCDKHTMMGIATAYPAFYKQDFDTYKQFLTEQKFDIPFGKHRYVGTIDGLFQDHAGDWWIFETKTASAQSLNEDYFERVKIDSQVTGYMHGGKKILGVMPRGVIYNVIKKPSIRLKAGETLVAFQRRCFEEYTHFAKEKSYFTRTEVMVSDHRLESWTQTTNYLIQNLAEKIERGTSEIWPMNTGACKAYFSTCPYMNACVTGKYNKLLYEKDTSGK